MQILQVAITIAVFLLMLVALILVHELGHFVTARLFGMRVHEFGIGMPPRAKVLRSKGETLYTLNWLPLGGFVRLEGEDGDSDEPRSFAVAKLWKQLTVLVAGVAMNLVLAVVIFTIVGLAAPVTGVRFWEVQADSPAAAAGLQAGDTILSVNGEQSVNGDILGLVRAHPGEKVTLGIVREGAPRDVVVSLRQTSQLDDTHGPLGISGSTKPFEYIDLGGRSLGDAVKVGVSSTGQALTLVWKGLGALVSSLSHPTTAPAVAGPIGIASMVGQVLWQAGPLWTLYLAGVLSANLALMNFLPIPALDGGRMFILLLKALFRRSARVARRLGVRVDGPSSETAIAAERLTYLVGFVFLFGLIIWISVFDVIRLGSGAVTP